MEERLEMKTRTEVLGLLTELIEDEVSLAEMAKGYEAIAAYRTMLDSPSMESDDELDDLIPDIIEQFNQGVEALKKAERDKVLSANLKQKEALVEELRNLIQDEENIGKAFNTFNELQEKWNEIGDIPQSQYGRVQTEYSRLRESFFYTINIYKELADHDKRINLKKKSELVEHVRALQTETSIQTADKKLKELIKRWDDIGATFPQDWERVKEEFWTGARAIMSKVDEHYEGIRARQTERLEQKKALVKRVQDVASKEREKSKEWQDATEKVIGIQAEWKKIGFSKDNQSIWVEFRSACDEFFTAKQSYYDKIGESYKERKEQKLNLIAKAESLASSEDWKNTSLVLQDLQKEWKSIGPASPRDENKLWKQFRSHCDSFFNARNRNFKDRKAEEQENLKVKQDIISRVKAFEMSGNRSKDMQDLKAFSMEWNGAGYVPFKVKDSIYKEYKTELDAQYAKIKLDDKEKRDLAMQSKLDSIKNDPKSINREKTSIRRQIDTLIKDNRQYENNLGFFSDPSPANPLVKEVYKKMKRNDERIKELKAALKMLDKV